MFLKGLLFGIGFIVGIGVVATIALGIMALIHVAGNMAVIFKARQHRPGKSKDGHDSHRARMPFLAEFPFGAQERMDPFERKTEYLQ